MLHTCRLELRTSVFIQGSFIEQVTLNWGFERPVGRMGNGVSRIINSIGKADGLPVLPELAYRPIHNDKIIFHL